MQNGKLFWTTLLAVVFLNFGCRQEAPGLKTPKTTIARYVLAADPAFLRRQDTLFYGPERFSGYAFQLYASGDTQFVAAYLHGLEEGPTKKWYSNKQIAEERLYMDGKKEGVHRAWYSDGKLKFVFDVSNDAYTGEFKEWYPSGLLAKYFHYKDGQEAGSERLWWDDGTVRANYVIKNGKKYGLTGLKLCKNPYDSIVKK